MIICVCHRVSDRDIARAAQGGCGFEAMQEDLRVGTGCGACLEHAREAFALHGGRCAGCDGSQVCRREHDALAA